MFIVTGSDITDDMSCHSGPHRCCRRAAGVSDPRRAQANLLRPEDNPYLFQEGRDPGLSRGVALQSEFRMIDVGGVMLKPFGARLLQISVPWWLMCDPSVRTLPGPPLTSARPLTSPGSRFGGCFPTEAPSLCRLLSQIYSAAVRAVLSGIQCFSSTASLAKVSSYPKRLQVWRRARGLMRCCFRLKTWQRTPW